MGGAKSAATGFGRLPLAWVLVCLDSPASQATSRCHLGRKAGVTNTMYIVGMLRVPAKGKMAMAASVQVQPRTRNTNQSSTKLRPEASTLLPHGQKIQTCSQHNPIWPRPARPRTPRIRSRIATGALPNDLERTEAPQ